MEDIELENIVQAKLSYKNCLANFSILKLKEKSTQYQFKLKLSQNFKSVSSHPFSPQLLLRELFHLSNLTQNQLAYKLGISQSALTKWLNGKIRNPNAKNFERLMQVYFQVLLTIRGDKYKGTF